MLQDEKIIELYYRRNERALLETSDKYGYYCRGLAKRIVNDEGTAEDCFNDSLNESWDSIPPASPKSLKLFMGKITRQLSLKHVREDQIVKQGGGEATLAIDELEECVVDLAGQNEEHTEENTTIREVLNRFLATLSGQERRIFVRRYWYCSSVEEIAAALDLSEDSVRTSLSGARGKLKEDLEKAGVVL